MKYLSQVLILLICFPCLGQIKSAALPGAAQAGKKAKGSVLIIANCAGVSVDIDGYPCGHAPVQVDELETGKHTVKLSKENYLEQSKTVVIKAGKTTTLKVTMTEYAYLHFGNLPGISEMGLDGVEIFPEPGKKITIPPGSHVVTFNSPSHQIVKQALKLNSGEATRLELDTRPKTRRSAILKSILLPGWGQHYAGKSALSVLYPILQIGALSGVLYAINEYNSRVEEYDQSRDAYLAARDVTVIESARQNMFRKYKGIENAQSQRSAVIAAAAGLWIWNVLDAVIWPPVRREKLQLIPIEQAGLHPFIMPDQRMTRVGLCWRF